MPPFSRTSEHYPSFLKWLYHSRLARILFFITITLFSTTLFMGIALLVIRFSFGLAPSELQAVMQDMSNAPISALKIYQFFLSVGMFLVPPVVYAMIAAKNPTAHLKLNKGFGWKILLLIPLILIAAFVLENWLLALNQSIPLPEALEQIKSQEEQIDKLMKGFLKMDTISVLLGNLFLVGVVAGVSEELFFRGFLQRFLSKWTMNIHVGVWLAAFIFGAIHQQFYNFIPRMMLGVLFGYLFYWSASLWVPIIAHFLHNSIQIIFVYFRPEAVDQEFAPADPFSLYMIPTVIISAFFLYSLLKIFYQQTRNSSLQKK